MDIEKRTEELWDSLNNERLEKEIIEFNKRCFDNDTPKHLYAKMNPNETFLFFDVEDGDGKVSTSDCCFICTHSQPFDYIKQKEIGNSKVFAENHPDCPFRKTDENDEPLSEEVMCSDIMRKYSNVIKDDMFNKSPRFQLWLKQMIDLTKFSIKETMMAYIATNLDVNEKVKNIGKTAIDEPER